MNNNKKKLEDKILNWSKRFIYSLNDYDLVEIIRNENLSKFNSENLKLFSNYGTWDFIPDFALIVKNKKNNNKFELILINRDNKSVGLRSIGEMMCYNKISNPLYSFLISEKGHSDEISYFMINENFRSKLMNYSDKSLIIFSFEDLNDRVKEEAIIPSMLRKMVNV